MLFLTFSSPLWLQVSEGVSSLKKKERKLAYIEFFCLAYNDQCQNCLLLSLIAWPSFLCRSLRNCARHRY